MRNALAKLSAPLAARAGDRSGMGTATSNPLADRISNWRPRALSCEKWVEKPLTAWREELAHSNSGPVPLRYGARF